MAPGRSTLLLLACVVAAACSRAAADAPRPPPSASVAIAPSAASAPSAAPTAATPTASPSTSPAPTPRSLPLPDGRAAWFTLPGDPRARRLIAHVHGVCGGPEYACAGWMRAATELGPMVCPTGNARCGDARTGPASWEAPSWGELVVAMDRDLEASIARVASASPGALDREGAILGGYSRGGYAVPVIAGMHPRRWPLLVVIEADAPMSAASLAKAGVRAVALVAAEHGAERAGMTRTAAALSAGGVRARLFLMARSSHLYPDDMDDVMRRALAFLVAEGDAGSP